MQAGSPCWPAALVILLAACTEPQPEQVPTPLSNAELVELSATEAVQLIRQGHITATALVSAVLERARQNRSLNAYISLDEAGALDRARQIDEQIRQGNKTGALLGVPLAIKDNIEVAGLPNTAGTPALEEFVPGQHAPVVRSLVDAGAIILGKTNMHELAFGITSNNRYFGAVGNPYQPDRFPGGSSGGTAAAVAGRMATAGLGTDTGGSVRIPAALSGLYGFRPSVGRYSRQGITPITRTRDTAGPITRTASDLVLLDAVMAGISPDFAPANLQALRLGMPRYLYKQVDRRIMPVIDNALQVLRGQGVELIETDFSEALAYLPRLSPLTMYEAAEEIPAYLEAKLDGKLSFSAFIGRIAGTDVRHMFENFIAGEQRPSAEAYQLALQETLPDYREAVQRYFDDNRLAAMIFPTVVITARPIAGSERTILLNGEEVPTFQTVTRNTGPGSYAGIPGITIPVGLDKEGLPVALGLDGPYRSDRRLLAIALALEKVFGLLPPPPE